MQPSKQDQPLDIALNGLLAAEDAIAEAAADPIAADYWRDRHTEAMRDLRPLLFSDKPRA